MRALSTCDFCGNEAAGTFELLPSELEPTETEQRRVVLCPHCQGQLEDLLEPLFARLGSATSDSGSSSNPSNSSADRPPVSGDESPDNSGTSGTTPRMGTDPRETTGAETRATQGEQTEASRADDQKADEDTNEGSPQEDERATGTPTNKTPRGYRNVVRLLRNREFPMEKQAIRGLVAGAYELEDHEIDTILEYALEQGEFVEDGEMLRRP